jgi:hypothetical protein
VQLPNIKMTAQPAAQAAHLAAAAQGRELEVVAVIRVGFPAAFEAVRLIEGQQDGQRQHHGHERRVAPDVELARLPGKQHR